MERDSREAIKTQLLLSCLMKDDLALPIQSPYSGSYLSKQQLLGLFGKGSMFCRKKK